MEDSNQSNQETPKPLVEGLDYYMEDGFFVLTKAYLERRGYCCKNGCRHCPYGFIKGNETPKED